MKIKQINKFQPGGTITPEYARLLGRRGMPGDKEALAASGYNSKGQPLITFGGGEFSGSGAGVTFDESGIVEENVDYIRNTPLLQSFSDAFRNARKNNAKTFIFNGSKYTTEMSDNPTYVGKKYEPILNIREVLDENKKTISDSTRVEPYVGQIPGIHKRIKKHQRGGWLSKLGDLMLSAATTSPTSVTGGDAYGPTAMREIVKGDVEAAQEIQREDDTRAAAIMGTAAIITEMAVAGVVPTLVTTATGLGGGYVGNKVGTYADEKFGTKWIAPTLTLAGGIGGGIAGYKSLKPGYNYLIKNGIIGYKNIPENFIVTPKKYNGPLRHYENYDITPEHSNTRRHEIYLYDTLTGKNIGQIDVSSFKNNPSIVEYIVGDNAFKHKGVDLYSAAIHENPSGLISGERLVSPEKTISTWKYFPYKIIGKYGSHGQLNTGGNVVLLQKPARFIPKINTKIIEYQPNGKLNLNKTLTK